MSHSIYIKGEWVRTQDVKELRRIEADLHRARKEALALLELCTSDRFIYDPYVNVRELYPRVKRLVDLLGD